MQSQKRLSTQPAPTTNKLVAPAKRAEVRSAPVVLDAQALRQVSGGTGVGQNGPYKTW
jgi:hypothetical protein